MRVSVCVCVFVLKWGWGGGLYFLEYELSRFFKLLFWGVVEWGGLIRAARAKHNFCEGDSHFCASRSRKHSYLNSS